MDARALQNRLALAAALWRGVVREPLPKMEPGDPADQVQAFEIRVVDAVCELATPETARKAASATWDLVHERPETDPVKQHVTAWHEKLARLSVDR